MSSEDFKKFKTCLKQTKDAIDMANDEDIKKLEQSLADRYFGKKLRNNVDSSFLAEFSEYNVKNKEYDKKIDYKKLLDSLIKEATAEFKKVKLNLKNYLKIDYASFLKKIYNMKGEEIKKAEINASGKNLENLEKTKAWMENLKEDTKIQGLVIPTSHDAGTHSIEIDSPDDALGNAAKTQSLNFMGQLRAGVRSFDWRMKLENGIPVFFHGPITGGPATDGIRQITKFLEIHKKEIIILTMVHCDKTCLDKFIKLPMVKIFINKFVLVPSKQEKMKVSELTISTFWDNTKNVIIFDKFGIDNFSFKDGYKSVFDPQKRNDENDDVMLENEISYLKNKDSDKLHKITPIHTAKVTDFFKKWRIAPLQESRNETFILKRIDKLLKSKDFIKEANMVSIDAVGEDKKFIQKLIDLNEERGHFKKIDTFHAGDS
ncbi:MAG: phosphatidylinositol-specific phospholipase C X domain containing protein [Candidatus Paraimprobicoccus trichonymphae]|uniref:1-phosphatidylinositol phosphodiesterase n=1 Tax=Candidatus Paraimprobicoccus trichonymphae TaxID=3033793 RepID=A0AA48KZJ2_9FIRM|nr:MAG: phosphatidylinositol-specific phospholipase C X domain containing protein [Candidatus Paraimprobicoccus trichonymphae]